MTMRAQLTEDRDAAIRNAEHLDGNARTYATGYAAGIDKMIQAIPEPPQNHPAEETPADG